MSKNNQPAQPEGELRERIRFALIRKIPLHSASHYEDMADAALSVIEPELARLRYLLADETQARIKAEKRENYNAINLKEYGAMQAELAAVTKERDGLSIGYHNALERCKSLDFSLDDERQAHAATKALMHQAADYLETWNNQLSRSMNTGTLARLVAKLRGTTPPQADSGEAG